MQERFVEEYPKDLNATQAAIRAGYSAPNAAAIAVGLLKKPQVRAAVQAALDARSARTGINADTVLTELLRIARADVGEAFDESGQMKPLRDMPEDVRRAIASIEVVDRPNDWPIRKVRFWDKTRGLEMLAKHLGLMNDRALNLNVDLSTLTDEQLRRLANGEDLVAILAGTARVG